MPRCEPRTSQRSSSGEPRTSALDHSCQRVCIAPTKVECFYWSHNLGANGSAAASVIWSARCIHTQSQRRRRTCSCAVRNIRIGRATVSIIPVFVAATPSSWNSVPLKCPCSAHFENSTLVVVRNGVARTGVYPTAERHCGKRKSNSGDYAL